MLNKIIFLFILSFSCYSNELAVGYVTGSKDTHESSTYNAMATSLNLQLSKEYAISMKINAQLDYFSYYDKMKYSDDVDLKLRLNKKIFNDYTGNIIVGSGLGSKVNDSNRLEYYSKFKVGFSIERRFNKVNFEMLSFINLAGGDIGLKFNTNFEIDRRYSVAIWMQKTVNSENAFSLNLISQFN